MKKLFKGAIPTIALLLVAIMSLTGVTYAWFTFGNNATVDTLNIDVKSVDGLLVSSTGKNGTWGAKISPDISAFKALAEVSTDGKLDGGNLVFYSAEYDADFDAITASTKLTNNDVDGSNSGWIEFPLFIKNDKAESIEVNLTNSTVNGTNFSKYAARVAVIQMGTANANNMLADGTYTITGTPKLEGIWEPNAKDHITDGNTWLANNNYDASDYAVQAEYFPVVDALYSSEKAYINVHSGDKFVISDADLDSIFHDTTSDQYYYTLNQMPDDKEYYVFQSTIPGSAGNFDYDHFTRLTLDDFFYEVAYKDIVGTSGKLANGEQGLVYVKESTGDYTGAFRRLPNNTALASSGTKYYKRVVLTEDVTKLKDGKLVIFYLDNYYDVADTDTVKVVLDANGKVINSSNITKIDSSNNAVKVNNICLYQYNKTTSCYQEITLTLDKYFNTVADAPSFKTLIADSNKQVFTANADKDEYTLVEYMDSVNLYVGVTDGGTTKRFTKNLISAGQVIVPGSLIITYNGATYPITADASNVFAISGIMSGTINYETGALTVTLDNSDTSTGKELRATCKYTDAFADGKYYTVIDNILEYADGAYTAYASEAALQADIASGTIYTKNATTGKYEKVANNSSITDAATNYANYYKKNTLYAEKASTILGKVKTNATTDGSNFKFTIEGNTVVEYKVVIWLEGQDCDCTNSIAGIPFQVSLVLNKKVETGETN